MLYAVEIIGKMHLATGTSSIFNAPCYFRSREGAWEFIKSQFGDKARAEQDNRWIVSRVAENALDEWELERIID